MQYMKRYVKETYHQIMRHGNQIGHMMILAVMNDICTAYDYAYVWDLEIYTPYRKKGYGTHELLEMVYRYGKVYVFPSNPESERLYARLGEQITINDCPEILKPAYQDCGMGYVIKSGDDE